MTILWLNTTMLVITHLVEFGISLQFHSSEVTPRKLKQLVATKLVHQGRPHHLLSPEELWNWFCLDYFPSFPFLAVS